MNKARAVVGLRKLAPLIAVTGLFMAGTTSWASPIVAGTMIVDCESLRQHAHIPLKGQWGFEWQPSDLTPAWHASDTFKLSREVPGTWGWEPALGAKTHLGFGVYRLEFQFKGECPRELAISFPQVGSAFDIHVVWPDGTFEALGGREACGLRR